MTLTRYQFTNPTSENLRVPVAGTAFWVEDMSGGDDSADNRTAIHPGDVSGSGLPTIQRSSAKFNDGFEYLTIEANSNATASNTVTLLIYNHAEVEITLPDA